jgi:hypothetical protein
MPVKTVLDRWRHRDQETDRGKKTRKDRSRDTKQKQGEKR